MGVLNNESYLVNGAFNGKLTKYQMLKNEQGQS